MALRSLFAGCALATALLGTTSVGVAGDTHVPAGIDAAIRKAREAERDGRADIAIALYREAHEAQPFAAEPLAAWGLLANRLGEPEAALVLLNAALATAPRERETRRGLADALVNLDRGAEALAVYRRLLTEDPADAVSWNGMGAALDGLGDHQEAQAAYREGLALTPGGPRPLDTLAVSPVVSGSAGDSDRPGTRLAAVEPVAGTPLPDRQGSVVRDP